MEHAVYSWLCSAVVAELLLPLQCHSVCSFWNLLLSYGHFPLHNNGRTYFVSFFHLAIYILMSLNFSTRHFLCQHSFIMCMLFLSKLNLKGNLLSLLYHPGRGAECCDEHTSVCVCLYVSVCTNFSKTTWPIFTKLLCLSPWPWLGHLAALWYVMYFRFCGPRHVLLLYINTGVYDCLVIK